MDGWGLKGKIWLDDLDSNQNEGDRKTPIVVVPGMLGSAEDHLTEMQALAPRRCVAVSLRARKERRVDVRLFVRRSRRRHPGDCENGERTGFLPVCLLGRSSLCHRIWVSVTGAFARIDPG